MSARIGITQRVEVVASYDERRDCLDQRWLVLLECLGFQPVPIPNCLSRVIEWMDMMALDGVVLSGGNDLADLPGAACPAPERDQTEKAVLAYAAAHNLPLLGVCRGFQIMNTYLGGRLEPVEKHVATRHAVELIVGDEEFVGYRDVNSYHDWGIPSNGSAPDLESRLQSLDGCIEAARHRKLPWVGIMWHPEREKPFCSHDLVLIASVFRSST